MIFGATAAPKIAPSLCAPLVGNTAGSSQLASSRAIRRLLLVEEAAEPVGRAHCLELNFPVLSVDVKDGGSGVLFVNQECIVWNDTVAFGSIYVLFVDI